MSMITTAVEAEVAFAPPRPGRIELRRRVKALARRLWRKPERAVVTHRDPEILGGTPVFVGTRVPLKNLIDYLEGGHSLDEFLDDFPTVTREQVMSALDEAQEALSQGTRAA